MKQFKIKVNGKEYMVEVEEVASNSLPPAAIPNVKTSPKKAEVMTTPVKPEKKKETTVTVPEGEESIVAPMPGKILKINMTEGDIVNEGDVILILEAMKMENEIIAFATGKVKKVFVEINDIVETDDLLLLIEY